MAEKKITWQDGSNQQVTLEAPAWTGSQKVTVKTPENVNEERAMDIIFYSKNDVSKSATLHLVQDGATFEASPRTLVFKADVIESKTIEVTTNVSSGDLVTLSTPANFDISKSGLVDGVITITVTPKSKNETGAVILNTLYVRLGGISLVVILRQESEYIVSTSYKDYRLTSPKFYLTSAASQDETSGVLITSSTVIPASEFGIFVKADSVQRTRVDHMSSGIDVETQETLSPEQTVAVGCEVSLPGYVRIRVVEPFQVALLVGGWSLFFGGNSLGTIIRDSGNAKISYDVSPEVDLMPATLTKVVVDSCSAQGNKVDSYTDLQDVVPSQSFNSGSTYDFLYSADATRTLEFTCRGTANYTSGSSRIENVPLKFALESSESFSIVSQTPGNSGTGVSSSQVVIKTLAENDGVMPLSDTCYVGTILEDTPNEDNSVYVFFVSQKVKLIDKPKYTIAFEVEVTEIYDRIYRIRVYEGEWTTIPATSVPDALYITVSYTPFGQGVLNKNVTLSGLKVIEEIGTTTNGEPWDNLQIVSVNGSNSGRYESINAYYMWLD